MSEYVAPRVRVEAADRKTFAVEIADTESLSEGVDLGNRTLGAILMPAAWSAADLTFEVSIDGENFFDLLDSEGSEVALTVAADDFLRLNVLDWSAIRYLKLRSGTSGSPVAQEGDRTITLVTVP
jgi:hypothetical protein